MAIFTANVAPGYLVWQAVGLAARPALAAYGVSLLITMGWSALFFGARRMDLALVDLGALWFSIVCVAALFWPINALAAALHLPYSVRVSVATVLNLRVMRIKLATTAG